MTSEQQNPLAVDKISSLILRFSVPSIIAMLVSAVYNIADQLLSEMRSAHSAMPLPTLHSHLP